MNRKPNIKALATSLGICAAVFLLTLIIRVVPAIHSLELKTIDWRFQFRGPVSVKEQPVVLVTIDDQSFESLPERWPWPRSYYAHVIDNLTKAGARVIGLDVILDTEDKHGTESDQALADALQQSGRVVLAGKFEERISLGQIQSYRFPVKPIPLFMQADSTWGITAIQSDPDGIHRRYFVVQNYERGLLPSFGLQVLRKYFRLKSSVVPKLSGRKVELGETAIPLSPGGLLMINFAGPPGSFTRYSFDSVIDDSSFSLKGDYDLDYFSTSLLPENVFKDKIVLIGSTVSELHDDFPTPFFEFKDNQGSLQEERMPGIEIHANAIWTILNQLYLKKLSNLLNLLVILILILLVYFISQKVSTVWSIIITAGFIITYLILLFLLFSNARFILEMVAPVVAMGLSFVASNLHQYILTQREKKMIVGAFEQFVPKKVVKQLLANPSELTLGGEERFLSVLFIDLENFTSVSEKLKPAELVQLINSFLTEMTDIIFKYDGIIDKYEGDAIMAEFGAPVHFEHHAKNACFAALEMVQALQRIDLSRFKEVVSKLSCRIGINSGEMIVGNMGSAKLFDYTVMGDAVNLASRLEGANKAYKTHIMISYDTYRLVKDVIWARPLDLIRVKGRRKPVRVFELIARRDKKIPVDLKSILPVFINGIKYYHQKNWDEAINCFNYCLKVVPDDGPSQLYLERCNQYLKKSPEKDWDGVYSIGQK